MVWRIVRIGDVISSYSAGSSGTGFPDCSDRFSADISCVLRQAVSTVASLRLVVMGRGVAEAKATLRKDLDGSGVVLSVLGVLPPEQLRRELFMADVLLCVSGHIST